MGPLDEDDLDDQGHTGVSDLELEPNPPQQV